LKGVIKNAITPKADTAREEFEAKKKELNTFWSGRAPAVLENLNKIEGEFDLQLPGGKGAVSRKVKYAFEIPEKDFGNFKTDIAKKAVDSMVPNTQEGESNLINFAKDRIKADYFDKIQEARTVAANNAFHDFLFEEFNVKLPAKQPGAGGGGVADGELTEEQKQAKAVFKQAGKTKSR
jgi:hypothetical protein